MAHVHSCHSDGTATVAELTAATRQAGANVLLLTDHDTLGARDAGEDGWRDGVLVVAGHEVSPRGGHLLVFGVDEVIGHAGRDERAILDAVAAAGGFGYAAHPFSRGSRMSTTIGRPHPWQVYDHPALAGLEVWSLTTDAAESWGSPLAALRGLRDPRRAVVEHGPPEGHVARWDALSRARPLGVLGGLDAHAPGIRIGGRVRSIMPHARWMDLVQTLVFLDAPLRDAAQVLAALRAGATALCVPPLGDPSGVRAWLEAGGERLAPGATAAAAGAVVHVESPGVPAEVVLLRDGAEVARAAGEAARFDAAAPGLHRVELRRGGRPWVLPAGWLLSG